MAVNPGEDIVNVWLQENCGYFTRQNINVQKVRGGKGKEIDILGMNKFGEKIWVEVTVSPNPYSTRKEEQVKTMVGIVEKKV